MDDEGEEGNFKGASEYARNEGTTTVRIEISVNFVKLIVRRYYLAENEKIKRDHGVKRRAYHSSLAVKQSVSSLCLLFFLLLLVLFVGFWKLCDEIHRNAWRGNFFPKNKPRYSSASVRYVPYVQRHLVGKSREIPRTLSCSPDHFRTRAKGSQCLIRKTLNNFGQTAIP